MSTPIIVTFRVIASLLLGGFSLLLCVFARGVSCGRLITGYSSRKDAKNAKKSRKEE
jgi:hypothetical protein